MICILLSIPKCSYQTIYAVLKNHIFFHTKLYQSLWNLWMVNSKSFCNFPIFAYGNYTVKVRSPLTLSSPRRKREKHLYQDLYQTLHKTKISRHINPFRKKNNKMFTNAFSNNHSKISTNLNKARKYLIFQMLNLH